MLRAALLALALTTPVVDAVPHHHAAAGQQALQQHQRLRAGNGAEHAAAAPAATRKNATVNNRPIIGILANPVDGVQGARSYFAASYVKWLEAAGARVVPLPFTDDAATMTAKLSSLNGALFTGGGASFSNPDGTMTPFGLAAQVVFNFSVAAGARGESWPLWGTCQGHELISFLAAGADPTVLTGGFDSENYTIPLNFTAAADGSRLYGAGSMPGPVRSILASQPVTMNNHEYGVTMETFAARPGLASRFQVLSTNVDRAGKEFISSMETTRESGLSIFTTQYHPEKVQFEWWAEEVINHSYDSVMANHWLALTFVNACRANSRSFPTPAAEAAALIYNYAPVYTGISADPSFVQTYYFP